MTLPENPDIRMNRVRVLAHDWYVLRKYEYDYRRRDGSWRALSREVYDRGNGAVILLHDQKRGTVVLVRQFRLPAFVNGHLDGWMLEAPAGLLDARGPAEAIRHGVRKRPAIGSARYRNCSSPI